MYDRIINKASFSMRKKRLCERQKRGNEQRMREKYCHVDKQIDKNRCTLPSLRGGC